ncbi:MAG: Uma2 family endonuclease, partial [Selenomonadaceae bacterium]|nr:Uma2 family endonuclease [Selenomonadaceae bacterium]
MSAEFAYQREREDYEIINGEFYMMARPSVNHQRISSNIVGIFDRYLDGKTCEAILEEDVYLSEEDNFVPDIMIVCDPNIVKDDAIHGVPDLVVEIISKSTVRKDKNEKFFAYEKYGVKEYWIVDPFMKCVDVYIL